MSTVAARAHKLPPAARAAELLDIVAAHIQHGQEHREPAQAMIRAFADAGLLQILAPAQYGGEEATAREFVELVETVARVDGSAAWTVMTMNEEMEIAAAHLPPDTMAAVCTTSPSTAIAGAGMPQGLVTKAGDRWRVTGRWRFVTGCPAADMIVAGARLDDSNRRMCYVLVPADQVAVLDTWDTVGLRGTGSHDVEMRDVLVPDDRVGLSDEAITALPDSPLFRLPAGLRFPFPKVGVACGIARAALDEFTKLAQIKRGRATGRLLRDQADVQLAVAEAEALLSSGRAFALDQLDQVWDAAVADEPVAPDVHARARLACTTAVANAVRAVETVCAAAGTTPNQAGGSLQRQLADVRAVPQHFMVGGYHRHSAGRVLLGLPAEDALF